VHIKRLRSSARYANQLFSHQIPKPAVAMGKMCKSRKPLERARRWYKRNANMLEERKKKYEAEANPIVSGRCLPACLQIHDADKRCGDSGSR
jgi:hypothetical protein